MSATQPDSLKFPSDIKLGPQWAKPEDIRSQLKTDEARVFFDQLNALAPLWEMKVDSRGQVDLSPNIYTTKPGWNYLSGLSPKPFGKDLDDTVIKLGKDLAGRTAEPDTTFVVNMGQKNVAAFSYDTAAKTFLPSSYSVKALGSPWVKPAAIRSQLKTKTARKAFDRVNALEPLWEMSVDSRGNIDISSYIYTTKAGWNYLSGLRSFGKDLDASVIAQCKDLFNVASEPGAFFVVNQLQDNAAVFVYKKGFKEYTP